MSNTIPQVADEGKDIFNYPPFALDMTPKIDRWHLKNSRATAYLKKQLYEVGTKHRMRGLFWELYIWKIIILQNIKNFSIQRIKERDDPLQMGHRSEQFSKEDMSISKIYLQK